MIVIFIRELFVVSCQLFVVSGWPESVRAHQRSAGFLACRIAVLSSRLTVRISPALRNIHALGDRTPSRLKTCDTAGRKACATNTTRLVH
jgi:hypothetical protein